MVPKAGIDPAFSAYQANVLPLNYSGIYILWGVLSGSNRYLLPSHDKALPIKLSTTQNIQNFGILTWINVAATRLLVDRQGIEPCGAARPTDLQSALSP